MKPLLATLASFGFGLGGALLIARFGFRWGLADIPTERSSHFKPVPKGGGIGIPPAAALAAFLFCPAPLGWVFGAAFVLSLMAFLNDRTELPVKARLAAVIVLSAVAVVTTQASVLSWSSPGSAALSALLVLFLAVYIAMSANFFNFMDGINGIAGLEAIVSFAALGLSAKYLAGGPGLFWISASLAAAAAGFLILNFPQARVFMGDAGSLFLGFLFAALVAGLATDVPSFLFLASFQSFFVIDGLSTIALRLLKGENIFRAHRQHLYQKLVHRRGWSHVRTASLYAAGQALGAGLAFALRDCGVGALFLLWGAQVAAYWALIAAWKFIDLRPARPSPR